MKNSPISLSIALNLILIGVICYQTAVKRGSEPARAEIAKNDAASVVTPVAPVRPPEPESVLGGPQAARPSFHWSSIESEDYSVYISNLRAIGCPESVIRDIITADVCDLYAQKRKALAAPIQAQFWEVAAASGDLEEFIDKKLDARFDSLWNERNELLKALLPAGSNQIENGGRGYYDHMLGDVVGGEKLRMMRDIERMYDDLIKEARASGLSKEEMEAKIAELRKLRAAEQEAILSNDELEEFKLRKSSGQNLYGFGFSEEDLRAIARLQPDLTGVSDKERDRLTAEAEEKIKKTLGAERFLEYKRAQSYEYGRLCEAAAEYGLPPGVAAEVYDLYQDAQKTAGDIRGNQNLSREERQERLDSLQERIERIAGDKIGGNALDAYRRHGGDWIDNLSRM